MFQFLRRKLADIKMDAGRYPISSDVEGRCRMLDDEEQSWYFRNERETLRMGNEKGWPVAQLISDSDEKITYKKYRHDATEVPEGMTKMQWAKIVTDFYRDLPFRHGAPNVKNIVYDTPDQLRVTNLDAARTHEGVSFYSLANGGSDDADAAEEWTYMSEHTLGWDLGYLWLMFMDEMPLDENNAISDAYTDGAAESPIHNEITKIAWDVRDN